MKKTFSRNGAQISDLAAEELPSTTRLIKIGNELYFKGADEKLLPTRKDQPPPDLRYFDQAQR